MKLKQSIDYLLEKSIIAFKFKHRLIKARLTSLLNKHNTKTAPLRQQGTVDLGIIFGLLTYIGKKKMQ